MYIWFMQRFLIYILLFLNSYIFAQQPYFINYTDKDGLPCNELYYMTQGKAGDLWIGTELGLVRYDGQEFHSYFNEDAKNKGISGVFEDEEGQIWCLNFANQIFYVENDSLHLYQAWEKTKDKINKPFKFSKTWKKDQIILETAQALFKINKNDTSSPLQLIKSYNNHLQINENQALIHSRVRGTKRIHYKKDSFELQDISCAHCFYWPNKGNLEYPHSYLESSLIASETDYYLLNLEFETPFPQQTTNELGQNFEDLKELPLLHKVKGDQLEAIPTAPSIQEYGRKLKITNHQFESDSILWLATNHGLFRWNLNQIKAKQYFNDMFVTDIVIDNEGNLWLSTLEQGLFFVPDLRIESIQLKTKNTKTTKLAVWDDQLFVGLGNGNVEVYSNAPEIEFQQYILASIKNAISLIKVDEEKQENWICNGLKSNIYGKNHQLKDLSPASSVKDLVFDQSGNVIVASGHGMYIFNNNQFDRLPHLDTLWFDHYRVHPLDSFIYLRSCCPRAYATLWRAQPEYEIWGGFSDDLYVFRAEGPKQIHLPNGKSITAMDILEDDQGHVWVASANQGLLKIVDEKVVRQISKKDGLPDVYITKMLLHEGQFWLATPKGIAKYNPNNDEIIVYDKYYGVPNLKITDMLIWNNRLYFAGDQELMSLDIRINPSAIAAPVIRLDRLWVNDSLIKATPQNFELNATENNLRIQLSAITFRSQAAYQFKYRLLPLEEDWVLVGSTSNNIRYPSLPPGEYEFEAYTINKWGKESKSPVRFQFSIAYPYYQRWWFMSLMVLIALGSILSIFWWQLKRIKKRNQDQLERSQLERDLRISQLTALKAQMNPHFVFNVLNSIQGLYALKETKEANKQLSRFARMVRLTLQYSNELMIPLSKELELLSLYLDIEKSRFSGELKLDIDIDEDIDIEAIKIPSLLIQPYVENAIKHGLLHKEGEKQLFLEVTWEEEDEILMVKVEDNGIGRQAAAEHNKKRQQHQSFASSANAKRLQLLNQERQQNAKIGIEYIDKVDENEHPSGTIVYLYIPI
jgi:two-component sensor histidine kinase